MGIAKQLRIETAPQGMGPLREQDPGPGAAYIHTRVTVQVPTAAVVLFLVENLLHFTLGVRMLDPKAGIEGLLRLPMVIACLLGIAFSLIQAPEAVAAIVIWGNLIGLLTIPLTLALILE